jgi:arylsulfatase A-like enzyme
MTLSKSLRSLWVLAFLFMVWPPAGAAPPPERPNFIFVLSDDIAQGDLGCYGQKLIQTPRLDQMAAEGTRYLQAYCGTSVCAPSRASFFTGLHTGHCPVRGNYEVPPEGQLPLPDRTVTIAEVAKSAGYATATFGKWGMGFFDSSGSPFNQGVDHFFGYNCQRHAHSYFPTYLYDDAQPFILPGNDGRGVGETYAQELIQNDMIRWLRLHANQPFLLFYAITLPHGRHEIDDVGIYRDKPWTDRQKAYAAQVTRVDSDMGELVDTLRELGIAEKTLIVFSGDNGSSFSPESEIGRRFDQASNGLRGYKRSMYEGALRQAALAWWPGTVPAGRVSDQPWAFWDLMPTFVELSGAALPTGYETDGKSLVSFLKGGPAPRRYYFYWELHPGDKPIQAARFGRWKAVRNGIHKPIEIYDVIDDAAESKDRAASRPDLVRRAADIFQAARRPDPHWPLDRRTEAHRASARKAWEIKRQRDKSTWIPENAMERSMKTTGRMPAPTHESRSR